MNIQKHFSNLFSSSAKFEVISLLIKSDIGIHLRLIEKITQLPIRSVQLAITSLCDEKFLYKKKVKKKVCYFCNKKHKSFNLLAEFIKSVDNEDIELRAETYTARAMEAIDFLESGYDFVSTVKL